MLVTIDPSSEAPLFEQIAGQLRRAIIEGRSIPGERLPSARELAESLDVNMHTVLRAYDALRQDGLVEVRRGRGAVVTGGGPGRARLLELARQFLREGAHQGLSLAELKQVLEEVT